jgi:hypothetical protein
VLQVAGGCRFLTDPLPTPEPSNRTAEINMPFAESREGPVIGASHAESS